METIKVENGNPQQLNVVTDRRITVLTEKGGKEGISSKVKMDKKVPLPLKKGAEIGKINIYQGEDKIAEYPLVAEIAVKKASFGELAKRMIKKIF